MRATWGRTAASSRHSSALLLLEHPEQAPICDERCCGATLQQHGLAVPQVMALLLRPQQVLHHLLNGRQLPLLPCVQGRLHGRAGLCLRHHHAHVLTVTRWLKQRQKVLPPLQIDSSSAVKAAGCSDMFLGLLPCTHVPAYVTLLCVA